MKKTYINAYTASIRRHRNAILNDKLREVHADTVWLSASLWSGVGIIMWMVFDIGNYFSDLALIAGLVFQTFIFVSSTHRASYLESRYGPIE